MQVEAQFHDGHLVVYLPNDLKIASVEVRFLPENPPLSHEDIRQRLQAAGRLWQPPQQKIVPSTPDDRW